MKATITLVLTLLLLQACASAPPQIDRRLVDAIQKDRGIVFFTCTYSGMHGIIVPVTLSLRAVGSAVTEEVDCRNTFNYLSGERVGVLIHPSRVFTKENPIGSIIALDLPAGDYEFFSYSGELYINSGIITSRSSIRSRPELSIRFTVLPNRQHYIGSLSFDYLSGKFKFEVLDNKDRDLPHFKKQLPETGSRDISVELMKLSTPSK